MRFIITFLEGIISFISPCVLPMLPVYVTYFAAGEGGAKRTLCKALAFTGGFTLISVSYTHLTLPTICSV